VARQLGTTNSLETRGRSPPSFAREIGRPALNRDFYFEPTLIASVDNSMTISLEEIIGPVISLIPCDGEEDAICIASDMVRNGRNGAVLIHSFPLEGAEAASSLRRLLMAPTGTRPV